MSDRGPRGWLAGLAVLGVATMAIAVGLTWWSAALQDETNRFYYSQTGQEQFSDEVYRYYDTLSINSYMMNSLVGPLLVSAVLSALAVLCVLARRWDLRHG
jgi:hypothetical protein